MLWRHLYFPVTSASLLIEDENWCSYLLSGVQRAEQPGANPYGQLDTLLMPHQESLIAAEMELNNYERLTEVVPAEPGSWSRWPRGSCPCSLGRTGSVRAQSCTCASAATCSAASGQWNAIGK